MNPLNTDAERVYTTSTDSAYLGRLVTLIRSLRRHGEDAPVLVLCLDAGSHDVLDRLRLPGVNLIAVEELAEADPDFGDAASDRSRLEWYYTSKSVFLKWAVERGREGAIFFDVDSDLFFHSSPAPVFEALGSGSMLLVEMRHPPDWHEADDLFGRFNSGALLVRRDPEGLQALSWWRARCIEWCGAEPSDGRFGDQKYLERMAEMPGVLTTGDKGFNLAFWNWGQYRLRELDGRWFVDEDLLVFSHMSRCKRLTRHVYAFNWRHPFRVPAGVRRACCRPYVRALGEAEQLLAKAVPRRALRIDDLRADRGHLPALVRAFVLRNVVHGRGPA